MDSFWLWILTLMLFVNSKVAHGEDYNLVNPDGSFDFGYDTPDAYHRSQGNRNDVVRGEFGSRSPETGAIDTVQYTAGPRGFRPQGKNIVRKYDFSQAGPRPVGSADDPYFDPSENPSYNFAFNTRPYSRQEVANRVGDVAGRYTYIDDIGERHQVEYIAGKNTGFHVKTPFPDSNPRAIGPLYFNGRGRPIPRGRTSIQRGLDGSYKFVSAGPDQRRTEVSDATGHVRGSYTYLDDKGVQHAVHYIAGPETGYRVLKNVNGPHLPTVFPFSRPDTLPSDFYDYLNPNGADLFDTAASGLIKPTPSSTKPLQPNSSKTGPDGSDIGNFDDTGDKSSATGFDDFGPTGSSGKGSFTYPTQSSTRVTRPFGNRRPTPSYDDDGFDVFNEDIFGSSKLQPSGTTNRPIIPSKPSYVDDGSYKPTGNDGSYTPSRDFSGETIGHPTGTAIYNDGEFDDKGAIGGTKRPVYGGRIPTSGRGTIVRNIGDRFVSIPPGSAVRAHVQAIDLLDIQGRVISPSDQLNAESSEQDVETSNVKEEYSTPATTTVSHTETTVSNGTQIQPLPL